MTDQRDIVTYQGGIQPVQPPGPGMFDSRKMRELKVRAQELWAHNQTRKLLHEDAAFLITDAEVKDMAAFADGVSRIDAIVDAHHPSSRDQVVAYAAQRKAHLAGKLNRHTDQTTDDLIARANGPLETHKPGFWERLR